MQHVAAEASLLSEQRLKHTGQVSEIDLLTALAMLGLHGCVKVLECWPKVLFTTTFFVLIELSAGEF